MVFQIFFLGASPPPQKKNLNGCQPNMSRDSMWYDDDNEYGGIKKKLCKSRVVDLARKIQAAKP